MNFNLNATFDFDVMRLDACIRNLGLAIPNVDGGVDVQVQVDVNA